MEPLLRSTAEIEMRHFCFRGLRRFCTLLLQRASRRRPGNAGSDIPRLLDCGCGTTANLAMLDRFGRSYGFDISPLALSVGREGGRRRLARANVNAAPFTSGAIDIVTSFDVLYALEKEDERTAIAEMYRLLKPGGFALINVAAMNVLRGDHSVLSREVRRYSRDDLREPLTAAGFSIVRLTYTNLTLFLPLLLMRGFQRLRGLRQEEEAQSGFSLPPAPLNAALSMLLLAETVWLRWFDEPFGSSLLCLAQKPQKPLTGADGART
jgi:SAM-dependent methyltransferase